MLSHKLHLTLSILTTLFLLTHADLDKNYCVARPKDCYPILIPVCAFPTDCNSYACTKTSANGCFACQDPTISYYTLGECPDYEEPPTEDNPPPVDTEKEQELDLEDLLGNCPDLGVAVQVNGDFIEGQFCCEELPETCPTVELPVCAVLYDCIGSMCHMTKTNACQACRDPNVQLIIPGTCYDTFGDSWLVSAIPEVNLWPQLPVAESGNVKTNEEEYSLYEGEGQFESSDDMKIWVWWHHH